MRWIVVLLCLMALPMASAVAVAPGEVEFSLFRDEAQSIYVVTADAAAAYSVGFWGSSGNYLNNGREWAFVFTDLDGPFSLDPTGTIEVETRIGGGAQEAGTAEVSWELIVDGQAAVTGRAQRVTYTQNTATTTWSERAPALEIDNGDTFRVFTTGHIAKGARMDLEPSKLVLPVLQGTPAPATDIAATYENVTGFPLDRTFANATSTTWLNWTIETNGTLEAAWNLTSGSVHVQVIAPDNVTVLDQVLNSTGLQELAPVVPGAWRVLLAAANATGDLSLRLATPAADPDLPDADADPDAGGTDGPDGNGTVDGKDPAKGSPLPIVWVAGALVLAARRRR